MSDNHFIVLGIHGEDVATVNEVVTNEDGSTTYIEHNVARVRMYIGDKEYDEDFDLPEIPDGSGIPKTMETYKYFLTETIEKRMKELEAQIV